MTDTVRKLRKEYTQAALSETEVRPQPLDQFAAWMEDALRAALPEPHAMHLATVGPDGRPSARLVLLRGFDAGGFRFFTNYESRKGQELTWNPAAAATFFWPELERQIRLEGTVQRLPMEDSEAYFQSRPRGSQLGAWASPQSRELEHRDALESRWADMEAHFKDQDPLPLPPYWGGFALQPHYLEFWQGRASRLHDRITYTQAEDGTWRLARLAP